MLYRIANQLIGPDEARKLADIIKSQPDKQGDDQVPKSHAYYSLAACSVLLGQLTEKVSKLVGKTLKPTYTYCRVYLKGAILAPHKDRPSCEYSVTINLSQTHPWIIYMDETGVTQTPGDGVIYRGCEIEHSRKEFEGDEYVQVFLHYVDANGPYKDYIYDNKHVQSKPVTIYRHVFETDVHRNHTTYYRFVEALPEPNIDELRQILDTKTLKDAEVGDNGGEVNISKRRSKIFWLPKTDEFVEVYKILHELISRCNQEFYKFHLTEINEDIQYTVYNSDDEGYYDWHLDMDPSKAKRKLSLVCQLSDPSEYEGGELQINTGNVLTVEKEKGTVILFPSYLLHRVTPVTKGTRRSLVMWIEGPAFV